MNDTRFRGVYLSIFSAHVHTHTLTHHTHSSILWWWRCDVLVDAVDVCVFRYMNSHDTNINPTDRALRVQLKDRVRALHENKWIKLTCFIFLVRTWSWHWAFRKSWLRFKKNRTNISLVAQRKICRASQERKKAKNEIVQTKHCVSLLEMNVNAFVCAVLDIIICTRRTVS